MKKQNKATKQKAKKSTKASSAASKPAKKKSESKKAVKTAVTAKKKETAAAKSTAPKKEPKITVKSIRTNSGVRDYPVVSKMPKGWKAVEGAMTTGPEGYVWITNGESIGSGKRQRALVKEKDYKPETTKPAKPAANTAEKSTSKKATAVSSKKTVATTAAAQPAPTAEQLAAKRRVYKSMPNNYSVVKGSVAQEDGTILIHNGKPLFKQNKDGTTEQVKDSRGKPAHKFASLIVDPQAFNEAQKKSRVGEIHRGNTKYIDKEPKPQRNYAVVKDKDGKVTVAKVKSIKEFDENGKNADPHLVEIDHKKYGLEKPSGVDHETFRKNRMSNNPLSLEDKDVFPEQKAQAKLTSRDTHKVLNHIKKNSKKKK